MKLLHIYAKSKQRVEIPQAVLDKLPSPLGLCASIQFLDQLPNIQKTIPDSIIGGQLLGCKSGPAEKIKPNVKAFLFIGSGQFHPVTVALDTGLPVFCFNPEDNQLTQISEEEKQDYLQKKKRSLVRFLHAKKVGILVSTKSGQNFMANALQLEQRKDREYFLFALDTLDMSYLNNFPWIECWVNTACPRIQDRNDPIINIDVVLNLENELKELEALN